MANKKRTFTAAAIVIVLLAVAAFVCYEVFIVKRGWVKTNEGTYYYDNNGNAYSGLNTMPDGTKRYFDPATNLMVTGEYQIDGNKYLFDGEGIMQFGVQKTGGVSKYYDTETGILKTGWIDTEGGKLYFNEETGDQALGLTVIGGLQYYFDAQSGLMKTGEIEVDGEKYCFDDTTGAGFDGFYENNGVKHAYMGGKLLRDVRAYADKHLYYFDSEGEIIRDVDGTKPMVALTYDDGPSIYTDSILDTFEEYGQRCTFFIVGDRISWNEDQARRETAMGCEQGNHTYSHNRLTDLTAEEMQEKLKGTDDELIRISGKPSTCLRPPEGKWNDTLKSVCGCPIILWSVDSRDWESKNADKICNRVIGHVQDGDIVLMHDLYQATADATKRIVPSLIEAGFQLVTVEELGLIKTNGTGLEDGVVYYSIPNR
ncbi:MAG: polysaccharide deacetylase family protein [Saccharofermentans sp.]|nr:polysaccharide deacetylase family protein [Saccharofermentans sp.]